MMRVRFRCVQVVGLAPQPSENALVSCCCLQVAALNLKVNTIAHWQFCTISHGLPSDLPVNAAPSAFFLVKENAKATFGVRNSSCDNLARARYSTTLIAC